MDYAKELAAAFGLQPWQTEKVIALLDEGNTIPFIARYRKEAHGSLDDQMIRALSEKLEYLRSLDKRREEVQGLIDQQGALTEELVQSLQKAQTLSELEDIYRPYRPKRKTRASVAKEKGLEPLAQQILTQDNVDPATLAEAFLDAEKGVETVEDALQGAKDILAEVISDDASIRRRLRVVSKSRGQMTARAVDETQESVYSMYYHYDIPVTKLPDHRILAMDRGEREGVLKVDLHLDAQLAENIVAGTYVTGSGKKAALVKEAAADAYDRLIFPSVERELRADLTARAAENAIGVFATNLRQLLMQPPVKGKVTIGLDPGYRTGCKTAVVDETGKVLATTVLYVTHGERKEKESEQTLLSLIRRHHATLIAIGNGTASKETEIFTARVLKENGLTGKVDYMVVSEAGASVYSASKLAAAEYPDLDLTLRSAVSIAHRLQDPLAELVKIDPKAIGVGQYQHDMPQKRLGEALSGVVEDCVNAVGVDLNTASPSLLENISGISAALAKNIVAYREENGAFTSRMELKKVPKLGPKAFEQCAGFLRVGESENILDNTAVHPESYAAAKALLQACGYTLQDVKNKKIADLREKAEQAGMEKLAQTLGIGMPTLSDMITELLRPGRDPREEVKGIALRSDIMDIKDLTVGMELSGTVRNVVDFGAFIDIGVHQDGLVHITQICDRYIKHPAEVLKVGQIVTVWVLSVDEKKGRIGLTMKKDSVKAASGEK